MNFKDIERVVVDFFEANGAEVDLDAGGSGEYFLDGLSLVDADVSLTALAVALQSPAVRQHKGPVCLRPASEDAARY